MAASIVRYRWLANPVFYLHSAACIARIARREELEVLHVQNKYSLPGGWLASQRLGIPVVFTIRETGIICPLGQCLMRYEPVHPQCGRWQHWYRECRPAYIEDYLDGRRRSARVNATLVWLWLDTQVRRCFFRRLDGVVGVSNGILEVYSQVGLLNGLRTRVIYNLPPGEAPQPSPEALLRLRERWGIGGDQKAVLFAGRFTPGKGTRDLVSAADIVVRQVPEAVFLFAGRGDLPSASPHTRMLGKLAHEDLLELYRAVDLVAVPSRQPEPLSRVALEAMAGGRALVGTRVGGTPELIDDGINGLLVPRGDVRQLAEAIEELLLNDDRRASMGEASRILTRTRFSAERSLAELVGFYRETISGRAGETG
jgi:glycosyltransferase involved in cell wall biosynthesis